MTRVRVTPLPCVNAHPYSERIDGVLTTIDGDLRGPFTTRGMPGSLVWVPAPLVPGPAYLIGRDVPAARADGTKLGRPLAAFWLDPTRLDTEHRLAIGTATSTRGTCCLPGVPVIRGQAGDHGFLTRLHAVPPWPAPLIPDLDPHQPPQPPRRHPWIHFRGEDWDILALAGVLIRAGTLHLLWRNGTATVAWEPIQTHLENLTMAEGRTTCASRTTQNLMVRVLSEWQVRPSGLDKTTETLVHRLMMDEALVSQRLHAL
jgi:hypothetical protein